MYNTVGISRRERAFKGYIETYNVEVVDKISLSDSLFLAKSSIVDLFKDLLQEKKGFKNILSTKITLKIWNNATNTYDIETAHFNSEAIMLYSESLSESDSNFAINSLSTFFESECDGSESNFNSVFMNLDTCIFFTLYLHSSK